MDTTQSQPINANASQQYTYSFVNTEKNYVLFYHILNIVFSILLGSFAFLTFREMFIQPTFSVLLVFVICFILFVLLALPVLYVYLDSLVPKKVSRLQIDSKAVFLPSAGIGGVLLNYIVATAYRFARSSSTGGRFTIKPKGWLIRSLRINREIYHAVTAGEWIDVEYYPFTLVVSKLTVYKQQPYDQLSPEEQTQKEVMSDFKRGWKYAGIVLIGLVVVGLVAYPATMKQEEPYRDQWTQRHEENQVTASLSMRGIKVSTVKMSHVGELYAEGTYFLDDNTLYKWLARRTTTSSSWKLFQRIQGSHNRQRKSAQHIKTEFQLVLHCTVRVNNL